MNRHGVHAPVGWTKWIVLLALVAAANGLVVGWVSAYESGTGSSSAEIAADVSSSDSSAPQGLLQPTLIHTQGFEGLSFPPTGWTRFDAGVPQGNPADYVWSRETCSVHPTRGGTAAAWAVGDGVLGSGLPCGGNYPHGSVIDSWLVYGGMDFSGYNGGMRANLDYQIDEPRDQSLLVCAWADGVSMACFASPVHQAAWRALGSMHFPNVAGHTDVVLGINYKDRDPDGTNFGVFVDNVVIEGLTTPVTSTPTNTVPPTTPTVTYTPSSTATSTDTVEPSETSTPSTTPSPTDTFTPLPTATNSLTPSPTTTSPPSHTPSMTSTPSSTPTPSDTPPVSDTPTATSTSTGPPTVPASSTPSVTLAATATNTAVTPGASATATSVDTPAATAEVSSTPTRTPITTMPPPETSEATDTVEPSSTTTPPTEAPTGSPTGQTPEPDWRIFLPMVFKESAQ